MQPQMCGAGTSSAKLAMANESDTAMPPPKAKPTAREMAQGFLMSLETENSLTELERSLIDKHGIDENKYRWETRYLEVAATEYAFYALREGKLGDRVAAVRHEYWRFWQELASMGGESAFIVNQCRARLNVYAQALDKDTRADVGLAVSTQFAHQFDPIPYGALPALLTAGGAVFDGAFQSVTEMLAQTDIEL